VLELYGSSSSVPEVEYFEEVGLGSDPPGCGAIRDPRMQLGMSASSHLNGCDLALRLGGLLQLGHLLTLDRRRRNLLTNRQE